MTDKPSLEPADDLATPVERPGGPSREDAAAAVRTLLQWAGDDPDREGLRETPHRVLAAYREWFAGYDHDPYNFLQRTFEETAGYDEMVLLRGVKFVSFCEHHIAPIIGTAHIGYMPNRRVVGISKLARVVEAYAKRLQIQERLTTQIADTLQQVLEPRGVAVVIEAEHQCMTTRGVQQHDVHMVTSRMLGSFRQNSSLKREFLDMVRQQA